MAQYKRDKNFIPTHDVLEKMAFSEIDLFNYLAAADAEGREERIEKAAMKTGRQEGRQEGAQEKAEQTARNLLTLHVDIDIIAESTGLSIDQIQKLQ